MKCKRVKDLLLTDFIDGQLDEALRQEVDVHLKMCKKCGQFEQELRHSAIEPLAELKEIEPPDSVWQGIKEALYEQNEGITFAKAAAVLRGYLDRFFSLPRPAFAFITVLAVFLVISGSMNLWSLRSRRLINAYVQEQMEFFEGLDTDNEDSLMTNNDNLEEAIEKYFL